MDTKRPNRGLLVSITHSNHVKQMDDALNINFRSYYACFGHLMSTRRPLNGH
jgi:hypothetical protein